MAVSVVQDGGHVRPLLLLAIAVLIEACSGDESREREPVLPDGDAGKVVARAIEAAGGWDRWIAAQDVAHVSTLMLMTPVGLIASESIGWFMAPLHRGAHARMESIGLREEVTLGLDGEIAWVVRGNSSVQDEDPARIDLIRFNLVSNLFWISLPFALAEIPATITDLGERRGEDGEQWRCLKVVFDKPNAAIPGEWFVFYFDTETGLIDRVHARLTASFLAHDIWVGKWLDYRDWDGFKKERVRKFFPANTEGEIVGNLVAEQLVEFVRFNNGFTAEHFRRPDSAVDGTEQITFSRGPALGI